MALLNAYANDNLVRVGVDFRDANGLLTDPAVVTAKYGTPAGSITSLTYGVDAALKHTETGIYYIDVAANRAGQWNYRFEGDDYASEGHFMVTPSVFV